MSAPAQTKVHPGGLSSYAVCVQIGKRSGVRKRWAKRAWLKVAERSALSLEALLVLRSNGSVEASRDVPTERATESRALADALGWTTAPQIPRIVEPADNAHRL